MLEYIHRDSERTWFARPEGMSPALHRLLIERGVASAEEADRFLHPDARSLHDPLLLSSMAAAVERIQAAMAAGEAICVYGDYDVDGVSASAILCGFLRGRGADARVYLPSRHTEGYGLNERAVREIAGWASLMVTVDCGVTSLELVALAKSLGLDVIVTDHHRPVEAAEGGYALPDCPVVNPLLADYPFPGLCGAGVAWKLVWALAGADEAMAWVDIAALATVADVVPLAGENRVIVRLGLERINAAPRLGIRALIASAGLEDRDITSSSIGFQLGPRLNAGGRLGSAMRSYRLLSTEDEAEALALAGELEAENTRRRSVELGILADARAQLRGFDFPAHRALILAGEDWNPGVIGLAASRLVEEYHYPVVLLTRQEELLTGSCRSIDAVDIHAALTACSAWLERYGGHRKAAGLALRPENLEGFRAAMDDWLATNVPPEGYIPREEYDGELDFGEITPGFIQSLEDLQPTGFGNPAPLFRAAADVVDARAVGAEGAHLKLTLAQGGHRLDGIAFRQGGLAGRLTERVDALFVPELNAYQGRVSAQLRVRCLRDEDPIGRVRAKLDREPAMQCEFLTQVFYNKKIAPVEAEAAVISVEDVAEAMTAHPQGTLVLTASLADAALLLRRLEPFAPDLYLGEIPGDPRAFNAVCAYPPSLAAPAGYRRVILWGLPEGICPEAPGAAILRGASAPAWAAELPDLEGLRAAYRAAMRVGQRPAYYRTMAQLARLVGEEAGLGDAAACAALLAMADMGLFRLSLEDGAPVVRRSDRKKASPEESAVWQALQRWRDAARNH